MIKEGTFREDLWFRLNVFPFTIPSLRHRLMDIPALVNFFIEQKTRQLNLYPQKQPAPGTTEVLQNYHWLGNDRELENVVERALIRGSASPEDRFLHFDELNLSPIPSPSPTELDLSAAGKQDRPVVLNMDDAMKKYIQYVLGLTKGKVAGEGGAAQLLGLPTSTLRNRMKKLGMLP